MTEIEIEIEIMFHECFLQHQLENDFPIEKITKTEATILYLKKLIDEEMTVSYRQCKRIIVNTNLFEFQRTVLVLHRNRTEAAMLTELINLYSICEELGKIDDKDFFKFDEELILLYTNSNQFEIYKGLESLEKRNLIELNNDSKLELKLNFKEIYNQLF